MKIWRLIGNKICPCSKQPASSKIWIWTKTSYPVGFPGGTSGKEPAYQCRRHKRYRLDPWVGKIHWRREWQPTPVFLPRESHGQRRLVLCASSTILNGNHSFSLTLGWWTTQALKSLFWVYYHLYKELLIECVSVLETWPELPLLLQNMCMLMVFQKAFSTSSL